MAERDVVRQLREMQELLKSMPEPVAYIVLDHSWGPGLPHVEGRDESGKRYVLCSPAVLDEVQHARFGFGSATDPFGVVGPEALGIPLYRREDMPDGWPGAAGQDGE